MARKLDEPGLLADILQNQALANWQRLGGKIQELPAHEAASLRRKTNQEWNLGHCLWMEKAGLVFRGRFTYRDSGILDATHLRFFTLREMKTLFERAGLDVQAVKPRLGGGNFLMQGLDVLVFGRLQGLRAKQYTLLGMRR